MAHYGVIYVSFSVKPKTSFLFVKWFHFINFFNKYFRLKQHVSGRQFTNHFKSANSLLLSMLDGLAKKRAIPIYFAIVDSSVS